MQSISTLDSEPMTHRFTAALGDSNNSLVSAGRPRDALFDFARSVELGAGYSVKTDHLLRA